MQLCLRWSPSHSWQGLLWRCNCLSSVSADQEAGMPPVSLLLWPCKTFKFVSVENLRCQARLRESH